MCRHEAHQGVGAQSTRETSSANVLAQSSFHRRTPEPLANGAEHRYSPPARSVGLNQNPTSKLREPGQPRQACCVLAAKVVGKSRRKGGCRSSSRSAPVRLYRQRSGLARDLVGSIHPNEVAQVNDLDSVHRKFVPRNTWLARGPRKGYASSRHRLAREVTSASRDFAPVYMEREILRVLSHMEIETRVVANAMSSLSGQCCGRLRGFAPAVPTPTTLPIMTPVSTDIRQLGIWTHLAACQRQSWTDLSARPRRHHADPKFRRLMVAPKRMANSSGRSQCRSPAYPRCSRLLMACSTVLRLCTGVSASSLLRGVRRHFWREQNMTEVRFTDHLVSRPDREGLGGRDAACADLHPSPAGKRTG